ncbi:MULTISPECIES: hypothetical protein [Acidiphilium]|jgi:hypothetical protein|uniref:Uncharacterized protein n=1 Tax=Acidiphilium cryptum (strain JF-5) TaxID=349163 RepID=A5G1P1_ACICJ|nr:MULTISPECIES: hypothetical protein [Acidiphilium]MBU6357031.1 hypothetical protein [Rhodospirillales bacterium]ABQ31773.1 hypothetical protein Acry_2582 [Acidiphilium cryptum JF-5]KDM67238.1 hypothetical protein ACIDI_42c00590 [Acidiphilium sp. JA12-A1]MBS3023056.1 hypothetical protein [Acidiphilium multivorum]MDE2327418.1 hypothetical protein [Rhodospirillales bacterium]
MRRAISVSVARRATALLLGCGIALWAAGPSYAAGPAAPRPGDFAGLRLVALPDAALARTTGTGIASPPVVIRVPDRGRVALWDELTAKPGDLGLPAGQVTITLNGR